MPIRCMKTVNPNRVRIFLKCAEENISAEIKRMSLLCMSLTLGVLRVSWDVSAMMA